MVTFERGYGLGGVIWRRGGIDDIIFRHDPGRHGVILDRPGIEEILGEIILGRLLESSAVDRRSIPP